MASSETERKTCFCTRQLHGSHGREYTSYFFGTQLFSLGLDRGDGPSVNIMPANTTAVFSCGNVGPAAIPPNDGVVRQRALAIQLQEDREQGSKVVKMPMNIAEHLCTRSARKNKIYTVF